MGETDRGKGSEHEKKEGRAEPRGKWMAGRKEVNIKECLKDKKKHYYFVWHFHFTIFRLLYLSFRSKKFHLHSSVDQFKGTERIFIKKAKI